MKDSLLLFFFWSPKLYFKGPLSLSLTPYHISKELRTIEANANAQCQISNRNLTIKGPHQYKKVLKGFQESNLIFLVGRNFWFSGIYSGPYTFLTISRSDFEDGGWAIRIPRERDPHHQFPLPLFSSFAQSSTHRSHRSHRSQVADCRPQRPQRVHVCTALALHLHCTTTDWCASH